MKISSEMGRSENTNVSNTIDKYNSKVLRERIISKYDKFRFFQDYILSTLKSLASTKTMRHLKNVTVDTCDVTWHCNTFVMITQRNAHLSLLTITLPNTICQKIGMHDRIVHSQRPHFVIARVVRYRMTRETINRR